MGHCTVPVISEICIETAQPHAPLLGGPVRLQLPLKAVNVEQQRPLGTQRPHGRSLALIVAPVAQLYAIPSHISVWHVAVAVLFQVMNELFVPHFPGTALIP